MSFHPWYSHWWVLNECLFKEQINKIFIHLYCVEMIDKDTLGGPSETSEIQDSQMHSRYPATYGIGASSPEMKSWHNSCYHIWLRLVAL